MGVLIKHKRQYVFLFTLMFFVFQIRHAQIISQYVDTDSGTTPKGIEIWNNTGATLDLSTNNLVIERYANGNSSSTTETTISSGTLADGKVLVIGGSGLATWMSSNYPAVTFINDSFSFNGNDALEVVYGGTTTDVFGAIGNNPGSAWSGSGVSTRDSNIGLLSTINTGTTTGFTDPSTRFEEVKSNPSILTGFGVAPTSSGGGSCSITDIGLTNISCNNNGTPSDSSDDITSFELNPTGSDLGTTYTVDLDGFSNISTNISGPFTTDTAIGTYGSATTFYLEPGSAGIGGDLDALVIDDNDINCFDIATITDPGSCSSGGGATVCGVVIDFETQGAGYSTSITELSDGSGDYFTQTDGTNINGTFIGADGSFFAAQDIDGDQPTLPVELNINNIDISTLTNLEFSIDLAEDDASDSDEDWDAADYVHIFYNIDGGTEQNLLWIESELSTGSNGRPLIDSDFDGIGDGTEITDTFATFTESIAGTGTSMDIRIEFNLDSADEDIAIDNVSVCGIDSSIDADSQVNTPTTQVPGGTIIADVATNVTNAVEVFKFDIEDLGTSDATATEFTQFRLVPGGDNTADWSQVIQGIRVVAEGTGGVVTQGDQNLTINDSEIIVEVTDTPQDETTIDDGTSREYTISVFLNTSGITDQEVIQLAIPSSTTNWATAPGSSQFASPFSGVEGNPFTIDVIGQTYAYINQPVNANVNLAMPTDVQIAYVDSNNNIDLAFTDSVEITSSGTLQTTPLTATPVDGIATFMGSAIIHTVAENNVVLNATSTASGFPTSLESDPFDIIIAPELFISEVADPGDDSSAKYVEVFNAGVTAIDFSSTEFFLTREANAGNSYEINQLSGVLPAKGYYIVSEYDNTDFNTTYGINTNVEANILGNGNDTYILSTSGGNSSEAINTQFDVYGEIGINGFTNDSSTDSNNSSTTDDTDWEYEDSRAYRLNPDVKFANTIWTSSEWLVDTDGANTADMTPGYGDQDYIYDGDWTSIGLGNPNSLTPTGSENIFVRSGSVTISGDTTIGDLVVRSGATLELAPGVKLTVTGDLVNEGLIIFESDDTGSAVLEAVAANSRIVGDGFEIHRYIPDSNRAFRYLAPSVSTNNSAKTSINANWQEGVNNTSQLDTDNQDPNPGFGTHITGSTIGANGFDATSTGNPSMFEWNASTQAWEAIPNTDNNTFFAGNAYAILIRGDRGTTLNSNTALGDPTVLRTTGEIHFGQFDVDDTNLSPADNSNGIFSLVGNPYQSQVDLEVLLENHATDINNNVAYIYDPTLGDVGGYATIDLENLSFSSTPNGTSANQYLQPNQAFFVESSGNSPSITFEESVKNNTDNQVGTFSDSQNTLPTHININLRDDNSQLIDGVRIVYANAYSSTINQNDAKKAWNFNESLTVYSENTNLSIEKRNLPTAVDTTQIQIFNYTKSEYSLSLDFQPNGQTSIEMYLYDQYTQDLIEILPNQITAYDFSVDQNIPETTSPQRFLILYEEATLGVGDYSENNFIVYPNPMPSNQLYIEGIEENIEGMYYTDIG